MNSKGDNTVPSTQYPHVSWHLLTLLFITTHAIHHTFLHRTVFASFAHYSPSAQPEQGEESHQGFTLRLLNRHTTTYINQFYTLFKSAIELFVACSRQYYIVAPSVLALNILFNWVKRIVSFTLLHVVRTD